MADGTTPEYSIEVNDVSMIFNIASEQLNNLKEYFIKIMRQDRKSTRLNSSHRL